MGDFRGKGADFLPSTLNSFLGAQLVERSRIIPLLHTTERRVIAYVVSYGAFMKGYMSIKSDASVFFFLLACF